MAAEDYSTRKAGCRIVLHNMDCIAGMREKLPGGSIDVVVTSPPYNLGTGYKAYDDTIPRQQYLDWMEEWSGIIAGILKDDGSVWVWGRRHGRVPAKIESLRDMVMVCARDQDFAMSLGANGTVWAWGSNKHRQLGIEGGEEHPDPVRIPGLERIVYIAATEIYKRAAVTVDGSLYAWGYW